MSYVKGSYETYQQVYAFNQTINAAFGVTEYNSVAALQQFVDSVVNKTFTDPKTQAYMGNDWQIVWGPVVYSENPGANSVIADNTMGLFFSPNQNLYVLAIAGTNIDSAYGWLQEDFNVTDTVAWTTVMGQGFTIPNAYSGAKISAGSHLGLLGLLQMQWNSASLLTALQNSLETLPAGSKVQLAVSGHSLGGTLSPVMALYLHDLQQQSNNWNSKGYVTKIHAMPTAGPTPGEVNFAAYYTYQVAQTAPAGQAGISYTSVYNTHDVVPHAWQQDEIAEIVTIYQGSGEINQPLLAHPKETITGSLAVGLFLRGCNTTAVKKIFFKNHTVPANTYTQVSAAPAVRTAVTAAFNSTLDSMITKKTFGLSYVLPSGMGEYAAYFVNFVRFAAQAGWQHTVAYSGDTSTTPYTNGLLQVVDVVAVFQGYKKSLLPSGQSETELHMAALGRVTGLDLRNLDTEELGNEAATASAS